MKCAESVIEVIIFNFIWPTKWRCQLANWTYRQRLTCYNIQCVALKSLPPAVQLFWSCIGFSQARSRLSSTRGFAFSRRAPAMSLTMPSSHPICPPQSALSKLLHNLGDLQKRVDGGQHRMSTKRANNSHSKSLPACRWINR